MKICRCSEPISWGNGWERIEMDKCSKCTIKEIWEELEDGGEWKENR